MDGSTNSIIFLIVLVAGMYMLVVRPNQVRAKKMRELMDSLEIGQRVMTAGGIWGTLRRVEEDLVDLEVSSGVTIQLEKAAISKVRTDEEDDA